MKAVIRVRGNVKVIGRTEDALTSLKLYTVNNCALIPDGDKYNGTLRKAKDYITWGKIKKETFEKILFKWVRLIGDKKVTKEYLSKKGYDVEKLYTDISSGKTKLSDLEVKTPIRLHPPRKGYKGSKRPYSLKGALGKREEIDELIERMI